MAVVPKDPQTKLFTQADAVKVKSQVDKMIGQSHPVDSQGKINLHSAGDAWKVSYET